MAFKQGESVNGGPLPTNFGLFSHQQVALAPFVGDIHSSRVEGVKEEAVTESDWGVRYSHVDDDDHVLWRRCTLDIPAQKAQYKSVLICFCNLWELQ